MEMRCALSGERVTRIPLDDRRFLERFQQPYAVTHRADIHARHPARLPGQRSDHAGEQPHGRELTRSDADGVTLVLALGRAHRGPRARSAATACGRRSATSIVGDGKPRVSGHIAYRAVLKREEVPADLWQSGRDPVGRSAHAFRALSAAARRTLQPRRGVPFRSLRRRLERGGRCRRAVGAFQGPASGSAAHARAHRDLAHVGVVRPRAGQGLVARAA